MKRCIEPVRGHISRLSLQLFVGGALISLRADQVRNMRPKLRVMLVRFIAKVGWVALASPGRPRRVWQQERKPTMQWV